MKSIQTMNRQLHSIKGFFTQPKMMPLATTQAMRFCTIPRTESKMPVLEAVAKIGKELVNFEDTAFFSVQHILKTNVPLFKHLIEDFKAKPNNIYVSGKGYSDSTVAEHCLKKLGLRYFKLENSYAAAGQYQQHLRNHLKQVWHHFIDN